GDYPVPVLSREEQDNIVKTLNTLQKVVNAKKEELNKCDYLIKARFVEMFGIPASGETEWPEYRLQDLVDMGWITYHMDGNHGSDYPRREEFVDSGVPYISANCLVNGRIDFNNAKFVTEERANRFRKGIAKNRDVLFAHNATVGPVAILETKESRVILGTSLTSYRCDGEHIIPEYLKAYLESERFIRQYETEMQQTTRKQVPITTQRKYSIVIPNISGQRAFAELSERIDKSKLLKSTIRFC
ncbi:MAG: restriction endonuclease subunit S, partial [Lactimicrobium massiliense]